MFLQRILRQAVSKAVEECGNIPSLPHPKATLNHLPSPKGNWNEKYAALQAKYNMHLGAGIGIFVGTILLGVFTGTLDLYNDIPDKPADIDSFRADE